MFILGGIMGKKLIITVFFIIITFIISYSILLIFPIKDIKSQMISVYLHDKQQTIKMDFDKYIFGVVAAEMPAEFEYDALCAQSICARTYTLKKSDKKSHPNNEDVCTDPKHCQAYLSDDALKEKWEKNYSKYKSKISDAVNDTGNLVITYNGELIDAIYHSSNNGFTENSEDVWQTKVEYLRSVESPDENSPDYNIKITFTPSELYGIIKSHYHDAVFEKGIGNISYTKGKNVKNINLYSIDITGKNLREILNIKSASFDIEEYPDKVIFITHGYGHGAGMSQYGANNLAKKGYDYQDIIMHYYTGVTVKTKE